MGERFPPYAYGPLIIAFASCGLIGAATTADRSVSLPAWAATWLAVGLAFFRMRVVDEIRDADVDRRGRPSRPIPRGLVTVTELRALSRGSLLAMLGVAAALSPGALAAGLAVSAFTLVAGKDFFAAALLKPRPLAGALAHSPAVPLLMLFSWEAHPASATAPSLGWLLVLAWAVGLGMEIGRKTVAPAEERPFVETYSAHLGRLPAVMLAATFLALGAIAVGGYAATLSGPGWPGAGAAWLAFGVPLGVGAAAAILVSAFALRRATGRVIGAWSAGLTLLLLLVAPLATLASGAASLAWSVP